MHDVSASTIRRLMRRYRVTARQIADQFDGAAGAGALCS
jgi:hypothetical protein